MNSLTGDFDLVVELTAGAVQRLIQGMHGADVLRHLFVRGYQNKNVELLINCPRIFLLPAGPPDDITRALATSRVLYHSRSISDASDPGLSAVADITVRAKLLFSNGDPAPLNGTAYLVADWSETTAADINVSSADPNVVAEVTGALLDFIASNGGGSYLIPPIGTNPPISSVAFQFIESYGDWLAVGLNFGSAVKGSKMQLQNIFMQEDWGLAISNDYAIGQILASLDAQLGALPPPFGPQPILLSDSNICIIPNPFGGCFLGAELKVYLDSLAIVLQYGQIAITGTLRQTSDSIFIPTITASFQAYATLSIGPNQILQVNVSQPSVQLNEWYAQLLNTLAGGAFANAVANGIKAALQSSGGSALSDVFSVNSLQSITSLGGAATVDIALTADSVSVVPEAIIVQGALGVAGLSVPPVAQAAAVRGASALSMNLNALGSWSPAHQATSFSWDFGDGSPLFQSTDAVAAVAVAHTWPSAGEYFVNLIVTNEAGAGCSTQLMVKPGILELFGPSDAGIWSVCSQSGDFEITFTVMASGFPAADAIVEIRTSTTPNKVVTLSTNQFGEANFTVNDSMFTAPPPPPPPGQTSNALAGMLVNAFCADYTWAWNYLWLWNCSWFQNWSPSVIGKFIAEVQTLSRFAGGPVSSVPGLIQDVALSQALLANLVQVVARGSDIFPLEMLFKAKGGAQHREQLEKVIAQATSNVELVRATVEKELRTRHIANAKTRLTAAAKVAADSVSERQALNQRLAAMVRGHIEPRVGHSRFKVGPTEAASKSPKGLKGKGQS